MSTIKSLVTLSYSDFHSQSSEDKKSQENQHALKLKQLQLQADKLSTEQELERLKAILKEQVYNMHDVDDIILTAEKISAHERGLEVINMLVEVYK